MQPSKENTEEIALFDFELTKAFQMAVLKNLVPEKDFDLEKIHSIVFGHAWRP